MYQLHWNESTLPWSRNEADSRYTRIKWVTLGLCAILGFSVALLPSPEVKRQKLEQVAPRLAKLITEKRQQPPPPAPKPKAEKKQAPEQKQIAARKKAERSGLMAMRSEIQQLQKAFQLDDLIKNEPLVKGNSIQTTRQDTNLLDRARQGSQGINTGRLSKSTGGQGLASRSTTDVQSKLTSGGGSERQSRSSGGNPRAGEEIELVFQSNKGSIFALYNRALRKDPTLQGKMTLQLTISADGRVSKCVVLSSDLKNPDLENKIRLLVLRFQFKPSKVSDVTVTYPIDFLPS